MTAVAVRNIRARVVAPAPRRLASASARPSRRCFAAIHDRARIRGLIAGTPVHRCRGDVGARIADGYGNHRIKRFQPRTRAH